MNSFSDVIKKIMFLGLENVVGRYYSSYRAFVYDNKDPENLNRLQLLVPHLNPSLPDKTWAYQKNNFSGKGYGIHMLPKKGDLVWVEYEYGDLDYPVWSFGHFGESDKPEEFTDDNVYGFKTPRGSIVLFNDVKDQETISIRLKGYKDTIEIKLDEIEIESKIIIVGKEAKEWSGKGETTQAKIEELWDAIDSLATSISSHTHISSSPGSPTPPPVTAANFSQASSKAKSSKAKVKEILSQKTKIE